MIKSFFKQLIELLDHLHLASLASERSGIAIESIILTRNNSLYIQSNLALRKEVLYNP
jgi:hypothetical protein